MTQLKLYKHHRLPPEITQYTVWLYHWFNLSHRDVEALLVELGISYAAIRLWCIEFELEYARRLRGKYRNYGDIFFIDEVFVKSQRRQHYLWRALDQDGVVADVLLQIPCDGKAENLLIHGG